MHDPYAALRHRDYRHLLGGSFLSAIGAEVLAVAVGWELYEKTKSPEALGLTGLAQFLPVLLLALPAGQAADHTSRKLLYQAAQGGLACLCLALAGLSYFQGPIPVIYVCLVLVGVCRAFSMPSRSALIPQVVPPEHLANAVTWNSTGWQLANVIGPGLGGLVLALVSSVAVIYLLAGLCVLSCVALLAPIRPFVAPRSGETRSLVNMLAGLRFVWRTDLLLAAITLDLFAVLLGGATALLPVFAVQILHVGPIGFGWLRAAPALGALGIAVILTHRPPFQQAGRALLLAVGGFGLATVVFGFSENVILSFAMLALTGALDNISVVVRGTLMQLLTPDAMRGRVAAVNSIFISSSNELGAFESGMTAEWFGPRISVVGGGIGTIVVVVAVMLRWPQLLRLGSLQVLDAQKRTRNEPVLVEESPRRPEP